MELGISRGGAQPYQPAHYDARQYDSDGDGIDEIAVALRTGNRREPVKWIIGATSSEESESASSDESSYLMPMPYFGGDGASFSVLESVTSAEAAGSLAERGEYADMRSGAAPHKQPFERPKPSKVFSGNVAKPEKGAEKRKRRGRGREVILDVDDVPCPPEQTLRRTSTGIRNLAKAVEPMAGPSRRQARSPHGPTPPETNLLDSVPQQGVTSSNDNNLRDHNPATDGASDTGTQHGDTNANRPTNPIPQSSVASPASQGPKGESLLSKAFREERLAAQQASAQPEITIVGLEGPFTEEELALWVQARERTKFNTQPESPRAKIMTVPDFITRTKGMLDDYANISRNCVNRGVRPGDFLHAEELAMIAHRRRSDSPVQREDTRRLRATPFSSDAVTVTRGSTSRGRGRGETRSEGDGPALVPHMRSPLGMPSARDDSQTENDDPEVRPMAPTPARLSTTSAEKMSEDNITPKPEKDQVLEESDSDKYPDVFSNTSEEESTDGDILERTLREDRERRNTIVPRTGLDGNHDDRNLSDARGYASPNNHSSGTKREMKWFDNELKSLNESEQRQSSIQRLESRVMTSSSLAQGDACRTAVLRGGEGAVTGGLSPRILCGIDIGNREDLKNDVEYAISSRSSQILRQVPARQRQSLVAPDQEDPVSQPAAQPAPSISRAPIVQRGFFPTSAANINITQRNVAAWHTSWPPPSNADYDAHDSLRVMAGPRNSPNRYSSYTRSSRNASRARLNGLSIGNSEALSILTEESHPESPTPAPVTIPGGDGQASPERRGECKSDSFAQDDEFVKAEEHEDIDSAVKMCWTCQKRHIVTRPLWLTKQSDSCLSMLPEWFPKNRFPEKEWATFDAKLTSYWEACRMLEGIDMRYTFGEPHRITLRSEWQMEYHDPTAEWAEVGYRGGWRKCRVGSEDPLVSAVERDCEICKKMIAVTEDARARGKEVSWPMMEGRVLGKNLDKIMGLEPATIFEFDVTTEAQVQRIKRDHERFVRLCMERTMAEDKRVVLERIRTTGY